MRKSDFTLPTLDDLFSTQAERDDAKLERVRDIPLAELHPEGVTLERVQLGQWNIPHPLQLGIVPFRLRGEQVVQRG